MRLAAPIVLISVVSAPSSADAHSYLVDPPARTMDDFHTEAPCGNVARTDTPTELYAGETIMVSWYTSVSHDNKFRVAFSPESDEGFDGYVLVDNIADVDGVFDHEAEVTLPSCTCEACTIQVEQLTISGLAGYYSCADVRLVGTDLEPCELMAGTGTSEDAGDGGSATATSDTGGMTTDPGEGSTAAGEGTGSSDSGDDSGCSCRADGSPGPWLVALVPVLALVRRRTRV